MVAQASGDRQVRQFFGQIVASQTVDLAFQVGGQIVEIPVLEGYTCAVALAKMLVDLGLSASGLTFPGDRPQRWRRKKTF